MVCLFWGVVITATLTIAVLVFDAPAILLWQVGLLFSLLPAHNIGTPEQPFYDYLLDDIIKCSPPLKWISPLRCFLSFR